jgi:anti-sigma regulatory factor (Ser/Thr protein kinase)
MDILARVRLPANQSSMSTLVQTAGTCARSQGDDNNQGAQIRLAAEEALVNIFRYAYGPEDEGDVTLTCRLDSRRKFVIEIEDQGMPFNLLDQAEPPLPADIVGGQVGGLGIRIVRHFTDDVQYQRKADKNVVRLIYDSVDFDDEPT